MMEIKHLQALQNNGFQNIGRKHSGNKLIFIKYLELHKLDQKNIKIICYLSNKNHKKPKAHTLSSCNFEC